MFTQIVNDSENITLSGVLEKIIKFYASSGVNIAIKFNEFYEFQKAYALLLGVLSRIGYSSYRSNIAIRKAFINFENLHKLYNVKTVAHFINHYFIERKKYHKIRIHQYSN